MRKLWLVLTISTLSSVMILGQKVKDVKHYKWDFILSFGSSFSKSNSSLGLSNFFEFDRAINDHIKIGICSSIDRFQSNEFYSSPYDYKVRISEISPLINYELNGFITIGGGPAFYDLGFSSDFNKLGFIIKSSLKYPKASRFFTVLDIQYRYSGKIDEIVDSYYHRSYSSYNINTNHFYLGLGLGIRL